jgi:outer membrane receptor protein involved in Fe transport
VGATDPQSGSAAGDGADQGTVQALIVTAQKREENIQDVPIAISAFSQKELEAQKIEGGFDLLKAIPNVTFSKNNFTSYNFSIRGVGTKAISATTDPGVAVSFNNIALIQNRLFEQEYFDIERVEVLRGPQGTLYGRNATSGVINVISAKPNLNDFDGWVKGEVGNYHTKRLSAMINMPLIEDKLAVRLAGALTDRQGYDFNSTTQNAVNGRDLWSGRLSIRFEPTDRVRANFIWERFNEDDNRSRTGKQLCHHDAGPDVMGSTNIADTTDGTPGTDEYEQSLLVRRAIFSQGCLPGGLYDDAAFGTPNGLSLNFILSLVALRDFPIPLMSTAVGVQPGSGGFAGYESIMKLGDPYGNMMQSRDLREIASIRDPHYTAKADLFELNLDFDITPSLTFSSQTAYNEDSTYSFQDFNRFNTLPSFTDTSQLDPVFQKDFSKMAPGGVFCDPQIGCSDVIAGFDIAQAKGKQFNQEFRLQSDFDGAVNFTLGANYTKFETLVDYYIFYNAITALASGLPLNSPGRFNSGAAGSPGVWNPTVCAASNFLLNRYLNYAQSPAVPTSDPNSSCPYIDPNPLNIGQNFQGDGHNYFRSKNPYELESWAVFGEGYWNIREDLRLTAGLRYTNDEKTFTPVPSQVLLAPSLIAGGTVASGYPEKPDIVQKWGEWTGRAVLDWKPDLPFTDETLIYASFAHGYKGGGANPPRPGFATKSEIKAMMLEQGYKQVDIDAWDEMGTFPIIELSGDEYSDVFNPEFVNAYEIGTKNGLLDGGLTLNLTGFFYDYTDYQISQIRDRTAVNENFDATIWGLELESMFAPSRNLQIIANIGYLDTRIADGQYSLDIMNRTQGDPNFTLVKPWAQLPSNCVVPTGVAENFILESGSSWNQTYYLQMCGMGGVFAAIGRPAPIDPATQEPYDKTNYPELHDGAGIFDDVGGNELPNAPHWTANLGAQYSWDVFGDGWTATVRGDAYWQAQSWARVYNSDPYDKLHGWYNANLALWIEKSEEELHIELYVKNLLGDTPITDAFLNSDDAGLTTNVFTLDPRLIGLSIRKGF